LKVGPNDPFYRDYSAHENHGNSIFTFSSVTTFTLYYQIGASDCYPT
jgi:hypothetical protein